MGNEAEKVFKNCLRVVLTSPNHLNMEIDTSQAVQATREVRISPEILCTYARGMKHFWSACGMRFYHYQRQQLRLSKLVSFYRIV